MLWDLLPEGATMGGAPVNFGLHVHALGASAKVVSRVGRDDLGVRAVEHLRAAGLATDLIQFDGAAPTGVVDVVLSADGDPTYKVSDEAAWDHIEALPEVLEAVRTADAVYFGSLAQRHPASGAAIQEIVTHAPAGALRVFDANLREPFVDAEVIEKSLEKATVLKVNSIELPLIAGMFHVAGSNLEELAAALAKRFDLSVIACTLGPSGSFLWTPTAVASHPGVPVKVADSVGAGDSFTATLVHGLLTGDSLDEIVKRANEVASFVCSQAGATPALPAHFLKISSPFQATKEVQPSCI